VEICLVQKVVSVVFPLPYTYIAVAKLIKFSNGSYTIVLPLMWSMQVYVCL